MSAEIVFSAWKNIWACHLIVGFLEKFSTLLKTRDPCDTYIFCIENWTMGLPPPSSGIIKSPHVKLGGVVNVSNLSSPVTVHDWILNRTGEVKDLPPNKLILRYHLSNLGSSVICFELIKSQNLRMSLKLVMFFLRTVSLGLYENSTTVPVKTQRWTWHKAVRRVRSSSFFGFCPLEVLFL